MWLVDDNTRLGARNSTCPASPTRRVHLGPALTMAFGPRNPTHPIGVACFGYKFGDLLTPVARLPKLGSSTPHLSQMSSPLLLLVVSSVIAFSVVNSQATDCHAIPCRNGGTCVGTLTNWTCVCTQGYTGLRCEIWDPCLNSPCQPHSQCISNNLDQYRCLCRSGWTGTNCEVDVDECSVDPPSPCEHGGICVNLPGSYACQCQPGFTGTRCEIDVAECANSPCHNGGVCMDEIGGYRCECPKGFDGPNCEHQINECASFPCANGAQCEDLIGRYLCHCLPGWSGPHCTVRVTTCADSPCLNGGLCENRTELSSFKSEEAERDFYCRCPKGFTGDLCEQKWTQTCSNVTCVNGGVCIDEGDGWHCVCPASHTGSLCEQLLPSTLPNQVTVSSERVLIQQPGTVGCANITCLNGGWCDADMCHCSEGYQGNRCELIVDPCAYRPCLHGGVCEHDQTMNNESSYTCRCPRGFEGKRCERNTFDCFTKPCGPYGTCVDQIDGLLCNCLPGASGDRCQLSDHRPTPMDTAQRLTSVIDPNSPPCPYQPCHNWAQCSSSNGTFTDAVVSSSRSVACQCDTAVGFFQGELCDLDVDECASNVQSEEGFSVCLNGAQCVNTHGSYFCRCPPGFEGTRCEHPVDPCSYTGNPICLNGGKCVSHGTSTQCFCPKGFSGPFCEIVWNQCASRPCRNGGICLNHLQSYTCLCPPGVTGSQCEIFKFNQTCSDDGADCPVQECLNGGTWVRQGGQPFCSCPFGFTGSLCEAQINLCRLAVVSPDSRALGQLQKILGSYEPNSDEYPLVTRALFASLLDGVDDLDPVLAHFGTNQSFTQLGLCDPRGTVQCISGQGTFNCLCKVGFNGKFCSEQMDYCKNADLQHNGTYCLNDGVCENQIGRPLGYTSGSLVPLAVCRCRPGFGGPRCDLFASHCVHSPCGFGGVCHPTGPWSTELTTVLVPTGSPYICLCPPDRAGFHCEVNLKEPCDESALNCTPGVPCIFVNGVPKCNCPAGSCGSNCQFQNEACLTTDRIENTIGWSGTHAELTECILSDCQSKRKNGQCDPDCNYLACDFDGLECMFAFTEPLPAVPMNPSAVKIDQSDEKLDPHQQDFGWSTQTDRRTTVTKQAAQPARPWSQCETITQAAIACHLKFGNNHCDPQCNHEHCLFDGWDCELLVNDTQPSVPAIDCLKACSESFDDRICRTRCNTSSIHHQESNCSSNQSCVDVEKPIPSVSAPLAGELVLLLGLPPHALFHSHSHTIKSPVLVQLVKGLCDLLHLEVHIVNIEQTVAYPVHLTTIRTDSIHSDVGSMLGAFKLSTLNRSDSWQSSFVPVWRNRRQAAGNATQSEYGQTLIGSQLYLQLDPAVCQLKGGSCFTHVDKAAEFVTASRHRRQHAFLKSVLSVQSISPDTLNQSDEQDTFISHWFGGLSWFWSSVLSTYTMWMLLTLLFISLVIGGLFSASHFQAQRHSSQSQQQYSHSCAAVSQKRSLTSYLQTIGRRRNAKKVQRAKVWYPEHGISDLITGLSKSSATMSSTRPLTSNMTDKTSNRTIRSLSIKQAAVAESARNGLLYYLTGQATFHDHVVSSDQSEYASLSKDPYVRSTTTFISTSLPSKTLKEEQHCWQSTQTYCDVTTNSQSFVGIFSQNSEGPPDTSDILGSRFNQSVHQPLATLSESYDGSGSTNSTRMGGTGSDPELPTMHTADSVDHQWPDLELNHLFRIAKQLIEGSRTDEPLLDHINMLDREAYRIHMAQYYTFPTNQSTSDLRNSRLNRLLDMRISETGESLLHLAARLNQPVSVIALLDFGADPTSVDEEGRTALLSAVCSGSLEAIHAILVHPLAGLNNPMCFVPSLLTDSTTPLIQAIKLADLDAFKLILHAMNVLVCTLARNAVSWASGYGNGAGQMDYLSTVPMQSKSTSPNESRSKTIGTDSTRCSPMSQDDNALSLLELNLTDSLGRTALHWAAATDQAEMVHCLLEAGAAYDVQTIYDETPLSLAAKEGAVSVCRLLLHAGANPELADYLDRCPLVLAEQNGHDEVAQLLKNFMNAGPVAVSELAHMPRVTDSTSEVYTKGLTDTYTTTFNSAFLTECCNPAFKPLRSIKYSGDSSRISVSATFTDVRQLRSVVTQRPTTKTNTISWCSPSNANWLSSVGTPDHSLYLNSINSGAPIVPNSSFIRGFKMERSPVDRAVSPCLERFSAKIPTRIPSHLRQQQYNQRYTQLEDELGQVGHSAPTDKGISNSHNHLLNSDSESPNRWSSSPSDTSPKQNQLKRTTGSDQCRPDPSSMGNGQTSITFPPILLSHTTDLKSYATTDPSRAFHVVYR
ncbi:hypothetical protein P879_02209 [Paragonimus westermani]|uniref:Notch n=1 Tax=Paragonimus westermani TaxID=34504 RepID=A0A8T0DD54_9TREM|nr:hypothetical protein P879_02209 [Paragonimus westermani]